ncbi:MAG: hypothetical protein JW973_16235 [Bacteroidales bacterium]|nr:hypothetical protein [Bacteroidales bacterium]
MELAQICQVNPLELRHEKIDFFIAASGYQTRSTYLSGMGFASHAKKYMISFSEDDHSKLRYKHEADFTAMGFAAFKASPDKPEEVENLIQSICNLSYKKEVSLLVDYSCMPKLWFASILESITRNDFHAKKVTVFFSYTPKKFNKENQKNTIKYLGPMILSKDHVKNRKPIALVAGLDNSYKSTKELIHKLKPASITAFIPENKNDPEYTASVLQNNKELLRVIDKNHIIHYEALEPESINSMLTSRCLDLRLNHEVVIMPQGPKSFSLVSSLLSIRYPDIKLWEVITSGKPADPDNGAANGEPVVLKVTFCSEEEE